MAKVLAFVRVDDHRGLRGKKDRMYLDDVPERQKLCVPDRECRKGLNDRDVVVVGRQIFDTMRHTPDRGVVFFVVHRAILPDDLWEAQGEFPFHKVGIPEEFAEKVRGMAPTTRVIAYGRLIRSSPVLARSIWMAGASPEQFVQIFSAGSAALGSEWSEPYANHPLWRFFAGLPPERKRFFLNLVPGLSQDNPASIQCVWM